ncbi:hypothetical protein CI610_01193 [invertebrate metagenome]|uniref:Uncharacterized protein n=1 Tax=invertebrate metagenome TaxID=1711999 RepID=A0A2H9T9G5_9ZZZZ
MAAKKLLKVICIVLCNLSSGLSIMWCSSCRSGVVIGFTDDQYEITLSGKSLLCFEFFVSLSGNCASQRHYTLPVLAEFQTEQNLTMFYFGFNNTDRREMAFPDDIRKRLLNILVYGINEVIKFHPSHSSVQGYMEKHFTKEKKDFYETLDNVITGYQMIAYLTLGIHNQNDYLYKNQYTLINPETAVFKAGEIYALRNPQGKNHPMLHIGQRIFLSKMGIGAIVFHTLGSIAHFYGDEWDGASLYELAISASQREPTMIPYPLWQEVMSDLQEPCQDIKQESY